jgi:hypothetical protein
MIRATVLRTAMVFLTLTTGLIILSLLVGHFIPSEMLSAANYNRDLINKANFILIDLNRDG